MNKIAPGFNLRDVPICWHKNVDSLDECTAPEVNAMTRIAVIGAGLSGLVFANMLGDTVQIQLFEKSRGYGGRMATRRQGAFQFDQGAQLFTVRSKSFE